MHKQIRKEISNLLKINDEQLQMQVAAYIGSNSTLDQWSKQEWEIIAKCAGGEELWFWFEETYFK